MAKKNVKDLRFIVDQELRDAERRNPSLYRRMLSRIRGKTVTAKDITDISEFPYEWDEAKVKRDGSTVDVYVDGMYGWWTITPELLLKVGALFETIKGDVVDNADCVQGGCESCDYGSIYRGHIRLYDVPDWVVFEVESPSE